MSQVSFFLINSRFKYDSLTAYVSKKNQSVVEICFLSQRAFTENGIYRRKLGEAHYARKKQTVMYKRC